MDKEFQIVRFSWEINKEKVSNDYKYNVKPYLIIKNFQSDTFETFYLTAGKELKFFVLEEQYCIGYEQSRGNWISCPFNNKTKAGTTQCENCEQDDFYSCRATCIGMQCFPKTPEAKAICDKKETYLYLTYVGGKFKVGVSLNPLRRWLGQGSMYGTILYKGYGLESRFYEQSIGTTLDLRLSVHTNEKIRYLGKKLPSERSIKIKFFEYLHQIKKLQLFPVKRDIEITNLFPYYQNIDSLTIKPILDNKLLKGRIFGVIGKLLVVREKESYYVTNLDQLIGKKCVTEKHHNSVSYFKQRTFYDF